MHKCQVKCSLPVATSGCALERLDSANAPQVQDDRAASLAPLLFVNLSDKGPVVLERRLELFSQSDRRLQALVGRNAEVVIGLGEILLNSIAVEIQPPSH